MSGSGIVFQIQIRGGPPWGFRLKGGKGTVIPLLISMVNAKGRHQGLKEGDHVLSINKVTTKEMTHADAQRAVKESVENLELEIERLSNCNGGMNGTSTLNCWDPTLNSIQSTSFSVLEDDAAHNMWSPSSRKKANLKLNCDLQQSRHESIEEKSQLQTKDKIPPQQQPSSEPVRNEEKSPVWKPFGEPYEGPQFRPVKLEITTTTRTTTAIPQTEQPKPKDHTTTEENSNSADNTYTYKDGTEGIPDKSSENIPNSSSTAMFVKSGWSSHLPPSQSPTITLLQKAREGQIPKGAIYIDDKSDSTPIPKNAVLIDQKVTVEGDKVHTDSYYAVPTSLTTESSSYTQKAPPKYDGIGPTEYGIPVGLRTGVKEEYASDWYKTMYKSLHRGKYPNEPNQAVHFGGYMSEPEFDRKEVYRMRYTATEHRRKPEKSVSYSAQLSASQADKKSTNVVDTSVVRHEPRKYTVEPRSIAEYEPGHSSLAEKEFQKHEHLGNVSPRPAQHSLNRRWANVRLSDGYESDSTLIRKTGRNLEVEPEQQKAWYKEIQKGGEIPLTGLRKTVPEKPATSQHQYQEKEVNIHYRSPIRYQEKEHIEEEELRKRQEDAMRKFYEEERHKKHQQELAEIEMRRHSDFFTPSQKSPISLHRYDNPFDSGLSTRMVHSGPPPKTMARAIYPFTAQTTRELSLNKGDIVYITKQVDKNWFEGEHHGLIGIFPTTYVEIIPSEKANLQPRKAIEGEAIVRFNFRALTPVELSLFKGEKVVLTRRMDRNWYEGRLGSKKGIFPASYVNVLREPGDFNYGTRSISPRLPPSPVYSPVANGPSSKIEGPTYHTGLHPLQDKPPLNMERIDTKSSLTQSLHIDTYNEPIPYRSLYSYKPQNDDELELREGDTVYVMEKCDDGWYVGTSLRTGLFGTFPGNYVERI